MLDTRKPRHHSHDGGLTKVSRVAFFGLILSLTSCAGGFRSDDSFQHYIDAMRLTEMSADDAARHLGQNGFACEANTDAKLHPLPSTYCRKTWDRARTYQVWIQPSKDDPNKSIVEASSTLVVA